MGCRQADQQWHTDLCPSCREVQRLVVGYHAILQLECIVRHELDAQGELGGPLLRRGHAGDHLRVPYRCHL